MFETEGLNRHYDDKLAGKLLSDRLHVVVKS